MGEREGKSLRFTVRLLRVRERERKREGERGKEEERGRRLCATIATAHQLTAVGAQLGKAVPVYTKVELFDYRFPKE